MKMSEKAPHKFVLILLLLLLMRCLLISAWPLHDNSRQSHQNNPQQQQQQEQEQQQQQQQQQQQYEQQYEQQQEQEQQQQQQYQQYQQHNHHQQHQLQSKDDLAAISEDAVYNYLMEFDYLPKSDIETGALRTEEQLKDAIRNLQRFGNIPATGEIDAATRKLIRTPRCGVGDSNETTTFSPDNLYHFKRHRMKRYVLQGAKWDKTDLTWSLVNQSMPEAGQVRLILRKALSVWERSSKLAFREVYSDQADIQVLFARRDHGDGYKFDGPGQILAHAFYPGVGRGGDAHFDYDENWSFSSKNTDEGTNFMGVAVHEFGHSLGLGHSSDQNAIMYPWYQGYEVDVNLPDDDRIAIQELYGLKIKAWAPYKPPPRPTTTSTTTTTAATTTTIRPLIYYPNNWPKYNNNYPKYPSQTYPNESPYNPRRINQHHQHQRHQYHHQHHYHHQRPPYQPELTTSTPPTTPTTSTIAPATTTTTTTRRPKLRTDSPHRTPQYHRPTKNWQHRSNVHPTKPRKLKPDNCMTSYDAISMIRRELFIFRGQFLWRIGERGLYAGYPTETRRLWTSLPDNFTRIDAVFENRERKIVFFIGRLYYVFDSVTLVRGYPQPLTTLGLPSSINQIDAAFVWGHNNRTYLFSNTLYWRLDDDTGRVELDYPRDLSIWNGIGYNIDAAFQYTNRKTYFFKGLGYWEFNDDLMSVAHIKQKLSSRKWMNCPRRINEVDEEQTWTSSLISEHNNDTDTGKVAITSDSNQSLSQSISSMSTCLSYLIILLSWHSNGLLHR